MTKVRTLATAAASAALVLFGGVAAVRQQVPSGLNVDSLATQLGLSADTKARIAPTVEELNALLDREAQARRADADTWSEFQSLRDSIAQALTPEQQRGFAVALGEAWGGRGMGYAHMSGFMGGRMGAGGHVGAGHMGGSMGAGRMGGFMGAGHMGGGMGHGRMVRAFMGGHMSGGGMGGYMHGGHGFTTPDTAGVAR